MNILLLGVSGNVTQGMISVIRRSDIQAKLIGACVFENSIGKYLVDDFYTSPYANSEDFISWLTKVCIKEDVDLVLSGVEENIIAISKSIDILKLSTRSEFIIALPDQLKIGNDKLLTAQWLRDNQCNYPLFADGSNAADIQELIDKVCFPLIAKPKSGKGSQGIHILKSYDDLSKVSNISSYVIQELLGDDDSEYTVAVYSDKNGVLQDMIILKRQLLNGTTVFAETVENQLIYDECKKITDKLGVRGPLNIQLRMHNHRPVCFELNIRFSGTTPMRDLIGFRDLRAAIDEYVCGQQCLEPFFNVQPAKIIRYTEEKIVQ